MEIRSLELGKPIERELAGGETHSYRITLAAGQYLRVVVEQRGIDVVVTLIGPDGKKIVGVDSPNGTQGPEPLSFVADASGEYRLEVRSLEKDAAPGRYEVKIEDVRMATPQDNTRIAAERAYIDGEALRARRTAESFTQALSKFEEALRLWRILEDRSREAGTLRNIAGIYDSLGEKQKAVDYYNQELALMRALGDRHAEATALTNIGTGYISLGEVQRSLEYYNQSLPLWGAIGDRRMEAVTLAAIAAIYTWRSEKQKAVDYYNQALILHRSLGELRGEAITLTGIGALYYGSEDHQKALDYYNQALALWRAARDQKLEAVTLIAIGYLYSSLGEREKALYYHNQALEISRAIRDRSMEVNALHSISTVYLALDQRHEALNNLLQAGAVSRAMGDRSEEANTLISIGSVYSELREREKALNYYTQALNLERAIGNRVKQAEILEAIAWVYYDQGEGVRAISILNEALVLHQATNNRQGEHRVHFRIGRIYTSLKEQQKALEHYAQALVLSRAMSNPSFEVGILWHLALFERDLSNFTEARSRIEATLNIVESVRTKIANPEWRASYLASNQDYYKFYVDLLMQLHKNNPSDRHDSEALQASERAKARSLLEMLTETHADIREGVDPALLERERTLQQQLNARSEYQIRLQSSKHTEDQKPAVEKELGTIKKELEALRTEFQEVQAQIRAKSPRYAALTQPQPLSLKEIQEQVLDSETLLLEYSLGEERSYLWAVTPTSLTSYELPKRAEIEAAARRVKDLLTARNREAEIQVKFEEPHEKRARVAKAGAKADAEYPEAAATLSQMILGPVADQIGKKRLLIVADGALQYLPFGALPVVRGPSSVASGKTTDNGRLATDKYQPLIVENEIVSLPSASVLAVLRRELAGRKPAPKTVAVLADPVFDKDDPRLKAVMASRKSEVAKAEKKPDEQPRTTSGDDIRSLQFERSVRQVDSIEGELRIPRLPFTRQEAEGIVALARAGDGMKALDFQASRPTATSDELSQYRIVHFATHGLLNSEQPELSGIVLSLVDENGKPQDGFLRAHEVYNLKLPADLVVLSGCKTGLGKEIKGEGLVGLTRGFMYAGAARVMVSLWDVNDAATAELMKRFYKAILKDGQRPAAALRAAQVSMWKEKRLQSPYYWAAFILQGEWK